MCGSIAIPFRAAPAVSDICVSNDGPIRHYFPSRRRQAWTARARVTGISPLRGSLRAAPTACGCGWTGVSLLDCRRGSGRTPVSPAAMRNSPPQAVLWTDGNRSAPYLAVFDAGLPAQMVLAHPPMSLQPPSRGPLANGRIQAAGYSIFKDQEEEDVTPSLCTGNK